MEVPCPIIKLDQIVVLQLYERLANGKRMDVAYLATNGYIYDSALFNFRALQEIFRVEPDLVVKENNELALEPLPNVCFRLTV